MAKSLEICVPDIGDFDEVEVVELLVAKGDVVAFDDPLVSVESDKATMEIPSTAAGTVVEVRVAEGDRVSEGSVLVLLDAEVGAQEAEASASEESVPTSDDAGAEKLASEVPESSPPESSATESDSRASEPKSPVAETRDEDQDGVAALQGEPERKISAAAQDPVPDRAGLPHASPLVRRYSRELGVSVESTQGTGPKGRILIEDLRRTVREKFAEPEGESRGSAAIPAMPAVDHAAFGEVHEEPLSRIQKVAGPGLHRSWLNVPHVTQHDAADVTELERFRRDRKEAAAERGVKLSPLLFVMKAVVIALSEFPKFRSSLAPEGDRLIVKDYFHLGIAVDTEQGLVVPVIRDVDRKGVFELAAEVSETAERARNRKLRPDDLRGACFTLSSLGGIGGRAFSPIVNAPEVAILGLSKTRVEPVWNGPSPLDWSGEAFPDNALPGPEGEARGVSDADPALAPGTFEPRLILPLSLSYDHRVIDGAEAVRFTTRLSQILSDPLNLLL